MSLWRSDRAFLLFGELFCPRRAFFCPGNGIVAPGGCDLESVQQKRSIRRSAALTLVASDRRPERDSLAERCRQPRAALPAGRGCRSPLCWSRPRASSAPISPGQRTTFFRAPRFSRHQPFQRDVWQAAPHDPLRRDAQLWRHRAPGRPPDGVPRRRRRQWPQPDLDHRPLPPRRRFERHAHGVPPVGWPQRNFCSGWSTPGPGRGRPGWRRAPRERGSRDDPAICSPGTSRLAAFDDGGGIRYTYR